MATTGSWSPIPRCEKGGRSALDHDYFNLVIDAVNALMAPTINPSIGGPAIVTNRNQVAWDFSTMVQAIANNTARLDNANATANCVGNVVQITFNF